MPLTNAEFESILGDTSKRIHGDITWTEDEDHSPAREFRIEVRSDAGHPLTVKGSINALAGTLSYTVVHAGGRPHLRAGPWEGPPQPVGRARRREAQAQVEREAQG